MLDRLRAETDWWRSYVVVEEESGDPPGLTMEPQWPCTSSAPSPPALVGTEDAFVAFINALSSAPALPHTDGLPARFKPCPQLWCVECLAHNLQVYTHRSKVFIAPTLSWRLINDIALRLTQPLVATKVDGPITEEIFQASIRRLQERIATLSLSEKLLTRVLATAIALMQWHSAHYFILGRNATCVLLRLHWTHTDTDQPRVNLIATGSMIGDNVALPAARRYPFIAVYSPNEDTSELWAQLTNEQQQHWLNSFIYLRSFRHAVHRGFPTGQLPSLLASAESPSSSSEDEEEERIDD